MTLACLLTLVALPTVWLLNRDDGADGDQMADTTEAPVESAPTTRSDALSPATVDPMALDESIYLSGDGTEQPDVVVDVAVAPAEEGEVMSARATFSSNFTAAALCVGGPGEIGTVLTVTNVNNNRSTDCTMVSGARIIEPEPGTIVLERSAYLQIADASDAPVPVEIRR
ncbi:MAG: hypothetical protein M3337_00690 [Actinomycetota bacterium]|nr:hypothetical protein [Actinomycetota bacterium]